MSRRSPTAATSPGTVVETASSDPATTPPSELSARRERLRLTLQGAVQGVGFRPYVYRLATGMGLAGWVLNDSRGVVIEVEGPRARLESFRHRLPSEKPDRALIHALDAAWIEPLGDGGFAIRQSAAAGARSAVVLPDIATCEACRRELLDPLNRRYRYPFTNCTNCGPRFTIVEELPYDRPHTTMRGFELCPSCRREYEEPLDRRFHAQPNACPACGPRLELTGAGGESLARDDEALRRAARELAAGRIVALKGLGGFHLLVDAANLEAVAELRRRKGRWEKPLAVMVPDLAAARELCLVDLAEADLLASPEAPIVLLKRRPRAAVAAAVAPGNPYLGVMLPYTPLHHLLLGELGRTLVATSGNLSDEPICTGNREARDRLGGIADLFLLHDRPIARHADDSVVYRLGERRQTIRRARGLAPLPVLVRRELPCVLAVGAHLKNTVALSLGSRVFLSQHIGDMETPQAHDAFERVIDDFLHLYDARPVAIAHDLHPDYTTTRWAEDAGRGGRSGDSAAPYAALARLPRLAIQHHHAHLASCLAENGSEERALGVTWDGTGYGPDGTVWGGEFLLGDAAGYERVARLRPFRLPGGEAAVREPRRVALSLLWELRGASSLDLATLPCIRSLSDGERRLFGGMLESGLRSPFTSSAGRLFDGVAALIGLRQRVAFEGQAAMLLEFAAAERVEGAYAFRVGPPSGEETAGGGCGDPPPLEVDWRGAVEALLADSLRGIDADIISARFHDGLAAAIVEVARAVGEPRVALSGGCFQNRRLTAAADRGMAAAGFEVLVHRQIPANDGGISLGQVAAVAARLAARQS